LGTERERWRMMTREGVVESRETGLRWRRGMGCSMQSKDSLGPLEGDVVALNL